MLITLLAAEKTLTEYNKTSIESNWIEWIGSLVSQAESSRKEENEYVCWISNTILQLIKTYYVSPSSPVEADSVLQR